MKASLTTSAIIHVSALAFALVSLGTPEPLDVANTETLPVDLVPIEEFSQIQQGDKTAPMTETAAPVPTTRPDIVENAQNAGDNKVDIKAPPMPTAKPSDNESAAAPPKQEKPAPVIDTKPTASTEVAKEDTAPPPQEVAALPQQKPDVTPPTPTPEPTPAEPTPAEPEEAMPLPDSVPLPVAKPKPEPPKEQAKPAEKPPEKKPEAKAAEKPTDKKVADRKQEVAKTASSKESDFNADDIAALLNKQAPANGGAKRSTQTASLGGKTNTGGTKLSQSEMDALRGQIQNNWSYIAGIEGADGVVIRVQMKLDQSGAIVGDPEVSSSGGSDTARRTLESSARRAVLRSSPFKNLPADKYDAWGDVVVNFTPSDLL
jgi:outer membrane biosynthesis protein TonB